MRPGRSTDTDEEATESTLFGVGSDNRGVSEVVGFLLIGITLMVMFTIYQAVGVPAQNMETEFRHNQQVEDDMLDVRNAIVETKISGTDSHSIVQLGSEYTQRLFALNPPSPTGTLQTTSPEPIVIEDGSGDITAEVCGETDLAGVDQVVDQTRFLEYRPTYSEYDEAGTLRYENSLLYHEFDGTERLRSSQRLVRGDTVTIIPLVSAFEANGKRAVSVEPRAGLLSVERVSNPVIRLPTALPEDMWEQALSGEVAPGDVTVTNGQLRLDLSGSYELRCGAVGVNDVPDTGDRDAYPETDSDIHPSEVAGVRFAGALSSTTNQHDLRLQFENLADSDISISRAGFNFYQGNNVQNYIDISANPDMSASTRLSRNTEAVVVDPQIQLPAQSTSTVYVAFPANTNSGAWLIVTVQYGTGERSQYFVNAQP